MSAIWADTGERARFVDTAIAGQLASLAGQLPADEPVSDTGAGQTFSVTVRDRCQYSYSLKVGRAPMCRTGCSAVIDAKVSGGTLNAEGSLIDYNAVVLALGATLEPLQDADLDTYPPFAGRNATPEVVAQYVCEGLLATIRRCCEVTPGFIRPNITRAKVTVSFSDINKASFKKENPAGLI
jgi:hypothetical protein